MTIKDFMNSGWTLKALRCVPSHTHIFILRLVWTSRNTVCHFRPSSEVKLSDGEMYEVRCEIRFGHFKNLWETLFKLVSCPSTHVLL